MTIDYSFFTLALRDTIYFNVSWLINLAATGMTMLVLTRDTEKWKSLMFPITVAWHIAGLPPSILVYAAAALLFAIDNLSLKGMGNILTTATRTGRMAIHKSGEKYREWDAKRIKAHPKTKLPKGLSKRLQKQKRRIDKEMKELIERGK